MANTNKKKGSKQKGVYKVTSGFYKGKYCVDATIGGKRIRKYCDTASQAKNEYYRLHVEGAKKSVSADELTFDDFFENVYLPHVKIQLAENTYENYKLKYRTHIKKHIGNMKLIDIEPEDCQRVIDDLTSPKKSCHEIVQTTMCGAFSYAVWLKKIKSNPARRLSFRTDLEKVTNETIRCLTVDEQKKFIEVARKHKHYEQYMVLLSTGLRISELVGLTWSECTLDAENPSIYIVQQLQYKSKSNQWIWKLPKRYIKRRIPIDETCRQILLLVKEASKDIPITEENKEFHDVVFRDKKGMPIQRRAYGEQLKRMAKKYNMEHFHPHTLRHTFATRCVEDGVNIKALSKILGHQSVTFTYNRYVHSQDEFLCNEMKKRTNYISS